MLLCTHKKQPHSPTYMGIYFYIMYFLFFKGSLTCARVTELHRYTHKNYIYIYIVAMHTRSVFRIARKPLYINDLRAFTLSSVYWFLFSGNALR